VVKTFQPDNKRGKMGNVATIFVLLSGKYRTWANGKTELTDHHNYGINHYLMPTLSLRRIKYYLNGVCNEKPYTPYIQTLIF
jgi:hypothetical protein